MSILDKLKHSATTCTADEMEQLGWELSQAVPDNAVLALHGDLGTGKTTLVRGIARGLDIKNNITSPTYTIYSIYQGRKQLLHMDAYRVASARDIDTLDIEEFLREPFLIAVEWPDNIAGFMPELPRFDLFLSIDSEENHLIQLR